MNGVSENGRPIPHKTIEDGEDDHEPRVHKAGMSAEIRRYPRTLFLPGTGKSPTMDGMIFTKMDHHIRTEDLWI